MGQLTLQMKMPMIWTFEAVQFDLKDTTKKGHCCRARFNGATEVSQISKHWMKSALIGSIFISFFYKISIYSLQATK